MRILLISDTHGHLDLINDVVQATAADAVLHAGDLGFYDEASAARLTNRELTLRIVHSSLPETTRRKAFGMSRAELIDLVQREAPLSDLPRYLDGSRRFRVPVYAVWGNHEDAEVVRAFHDGNYRVDNLFILDERRLHIAGGARIIGLGGNLLPSQKLFHKPIAGGGGKVWTTLSQYARLWKNASEDRSTYSCSILVSHVSPGKEPILRQFAAHLSADFAVSGHMGSPYCCTWSEFAIRSASEAHQALSIPITDLEAIWESEKRHGWRGQDEREMVELGLHLLKTPPADTEADGRGQTAPVWYRKTFFINLPDAQDGHAILAGEGGRFALQTYSQGREPSPPATTEVEDD